MYWNIHPLPHTPSWHNASLVKHRDNFTFYLYWNIISCMKMLATVHFTWMYSLKSFFFPHLPCCYGAFSALRKQSLSGAFVPISSLITPVLTVPYQLYGVSPLRSLVLWRFFIYLFIYLLAIRIYKSTS
jgi:hypothetical protein